jgi:hypothetical protein
MRRSVSSYFRVNIAYFVSAISALYGYCSPYSAMSRLSPLTHYGNDVDIAHVLQYMLFARSVCVRFMRCALSEMACHGQQMWLSRTLTTAVIHASFVHASCSGEVPWHLYVRSGAWQRIDSCHYIGYTLPKWWTLVSKQYPYTHSKDMPDSHMEEYYYRLVH